MATKRISSAQSNGSILVFSRGLRKVGCGFTVYRYGEEVSTGTLSLGPRADVYDAEICALAISAKHAASMADHPSHHTPVKHIPFSSDNQAAITNITSLAAHPAQTAFIVFRNAVDEFLLSHPDLTITVEWVKGHSGISGNERVDTLALKAASLTPTPWAKARTKSRAI